MASSPRIDELKKKFDENPRRYFAPLANEYRKSGDLEQAIELCRAYLPQQAGHMSGHIVFGQALFEAGQLDEARGVFETALGLDPENLIALRHLGDIARQGGDSSGARQWYQRVLDADPRNDEMAQQIATLDSVPPSVPTPTATPAVGGMGSWGDINPEQAAAAAASRAAAEQQSAAPPLVVEKSATAAVESLGDSPAPAPNPEFERDGEGAFALPSPEAAATRAVADVERSEEIELKPVLREPESVLPAPPPQVAREQEESTTGKGFGASNPFGFEVMEFVPPPREQDPAPARNESGSAGFGQPFTGEIAPSDATPAAFVTETMAELYLQQGFTQEALGVYRQLLAQNPRDEGLRDRIAALEKGSRSSVGVAAVSEEVIAHAARRHAREPETVRSFFAGLMRKRVLQRFDSYGEGGHFATESEVSAAPAWQPPVEPEDPGFRATDSTPSHGGHGSTEEGGATAAFIVPAGAAPPPGMAPGDDRRVEYQDARARTSEAPSAARSSEAPSAPPPRPIVEAVAAPVPGTIDTLFGGANVFGNDEQAAQVLSGAFPTVTSVPIAGRPAERATSELSLEHVFREADRKTGRSSGGFSFDQFFSDGSQKPAPRATDPTGTAVGGPDLPPDDDVAQFNDWLSGLKKK